MDLDERDDAELELTLRLIAELYAEATRLVPDGPGSCGGAGTTAARSDSPRTTRWDAICSGGRQPR